MCFRTVALSLLLCLGVLLAPATVSADQPAAPPVAPPVPAPAPAPVPEPPPAPPPLEPQPQADLGEVGVVTGEGVNLRVGPRMDNEPIVQLKRGAVVLIVERVPGWLGVRVPAGFPVAISAEHVETLSPDEVRVTARRLNVRVQPPEEGRPTPGAFRDAFHAGQVLTCISQDQGWVWVLAPEEVRAYLSSEYVRVLGPLAEHGAAVVAARAEREQEVRRLRQARQAALAAQAGLTVRTAIGKAQERLHRLRLEATNDRTPVALLSDELKTVLDGCPGAPPTEQTLGRIMLEDLERELELRVARADREVAKARGAPVSGPSPTAAPTSPLAEVEGTLTCESVPGFQAGVVYVVWSGEKPRHVARLTTGGPLPHPDLRALCDGKAHRFVGALPGERTLGLPVIDVREVR